MTDRATRSPRRPRPSGGVPVWRTRGGRRARRWLSALLAAVTVGLLARAALAPDDPGEPVVVAARALPAGKTLTSGDLGVVHLPSAARPPGARADPADLVGRRVSGPVVPREVLTAADVHAGELLADLPGDRLASWLPVADPLLAGVLRQGDVVDVHSPVDGSVVVRAALVLAVVADDRGQGVLLAVSEDGAGDLAAAVGADPAGAALSLALHRAATTHP